MARRARAHDRFMPSTVLALPLCIGMLATSGGCVLKKPPDTAAIRAEALPVELPGQWTAAGAGSGAIADNWLATFRDDQLSAAVAEAIAHNADLRVAAARVEQALGEPTDVTVHVEPANPRHLRPTRGYQPDELARVHQQRDRATGS